MSNVENLRSEPSAKAAKANDSGRNVAIPRAGTKSRLPLSSMLITLTAVAIASLLAWRMWDAYMTAPWTRDGTVRVYVVTMAPEVGGRIVTLPVADNQFVHKGDPLFEIDPADYRIALEQAQAMTQRDSATLDYARKNEKRRPRLRRTAGHRQTYTSKLQARWVNPKEQSPWTMPPSPRRSSTSAEPSFAPR